MAAVLPQPALHRPALALGDARRRRPGARGQANLFHLHGGNIHTYRRMIHHMDEGIGGWWRRCAHRPARQHPDRVHQRQRRRALLDNWPLVGGKMDLTEGGIRVPWIAHWPAVIAPGGVSDQPCMTMDWSATMLDVAGVAAHPAHPLDGVSLLPVLRDASGTAFRARCTGA
jgi:arylsulfatase A-like enzyme